MQFSVIIPAKNEEATLGRCLDSLANVDWDRNQFEVIVMDNGSSDRTAAIAREKGVNLFVMPGLTIAALRNFGVSQAKGDILVFLDADCTVSGDWLRNAARYISNLEVICFGSPPVVPENASWVQTAWFRIRQKSKICGEVAWLESMNMFVRREAFRAAGGFNEALVTCEDYDLSLRLKVLGKLIADDRIVAVHHGEAATVGHFFKKEYWRGTSNLRGVLHHGITLQELPSLLFPLVHSIFGLVVIVVLFTGVLRMSPLFISGGIALLLVWQVPILLMAAWKNRSAFDLPSVLQLYLLLNIYFLARGGALLQWR
jgi:glycosyltransferase involved in cell wall biosynthesis